MHDHILIGAHMIEEEGEARLCIADDLLAAAQRREGRGALVAVQVDDKVIFAAAQTARKAQDTEQTVVPSLLVDQQTLVDVPVLLHDVCEFLIGEEGDARGRIIVPQGSQHRRHKHEIAEVHEVDDEDVPIRAHCPSNESPCSISCHESVRRIVIRLCSRSYAAAGSSSAAPGRSSVSFVLTRPITDRVRK